MTNKNMTKSEIWGSRLSEQSTSGKSQVKYCTENGIAINTFRYWKRRMTLKPAPAFVKMRGIGRQECKAVIIRTGGVRIILQPEVPEHLVNTLLSALRSS